MADIGRFKDELESKSKEELMKMAQGIEGMSGKSRATKEQLIEAIRKKGGKR